MTGIPVADEQAGRRLEQERVTEIPGADEQAGRRLELERVLEDRQDWTGTDGGYDSKRTGLRKLQQRLCSELSLNLTGDRGFRFTRSYDKTDSCNERATRNDSDRFKYWGNTGSA